MPSERPRRLPVELRPTAEPFVEKDFYLDEFRGRSVLIAVAPEAAAARPDLRPLAGAVADLVRNGARVVFWWPDSGGAAERRLRGALRRARGLARRRLQPPAPFKRVAASLDGAEVDALRAELWGTLRRERMCVLVAAGAEPATFPGPVCALATALGIPKLVLLDARGGLVPDARRACPSSTRTSSTRSSGTARRNGPGSATAGRSSSPYARPSTAASRR
jgi:hypothetical protein